MPLRIENVCAATEDQLRGAGLIEFTHLADPNGRLTVYRPPIPGHHYGIGADHALGVSGGDLHTASVFDAQLEDGAYHQVAEVSGHWGETWHLVLFALMRYYNGAFLVGERQFGLDTMRRIWRMGGWLYYGRDEQRKGRPVLDCLGHPKTGDKVFDPLLTAFRSAVLRGEVRLYSREVIEQMQGMVFGPKTAAAADGYATDEQLTIKLADPGSPDLTYASMYAYHAVREMPSFPAPEPTWEAGTWGDLLHKGVDMKAAHPANLAATAPKKPRAGGLKVHV